MSLLVKDLMTKNVITIDCYATVEEAAKLVDKHDIGCLVAVNEGKVAGIVTERDLIRRVMLRFADPKAARISDIMSTPVITASPETKLQEAVRLMNERRIKKLVVVENDALLGLLSVTDVVRSVAFFEHVISSLCSRCQYGKSQPASTQQQSDESIGPQLIRTG